VTALKQSREQGGPHHRLKTTVEAWILPGDEDRWWRPHAYAGEGLGLWRGETYERNESREGWECSWVLFIGRGGSRVDGRWRGNGSHWWSSIKSTVSWRGDDGAANSLGKWRWHGLLDSSRWWRGAKGLMALKRGREGRQRCCQLEEDDAEGDGPKLGQIHWMGRHWNAN
jgi:hypothetical protein